MRVTVILFTSILLSSCVSKKKHLEQITFLQTKYEAEKTALAHELEGANGEINRLELHLAERKGENNALVAMQDKLQSRIDDLKAEIENTSNIAISTKETLNQNLKQKEQEIVRLQKLLSEVGQILDNWEIQMAEISQALRDSLQIFDKQFWSIDNRNGNGIVVFQEDFIFRTNSVSRLEDKGIDALEKISAILHNYPRIQMLITAHTDNTPPRNRSYEDNWNYSTLRAATIARLMTKEFYVSASQITAAGKGEFAPIASNETPQGRTQNRRIELVISPTIENMVRDIRRKLNEAQR